MSRDIFIVENQPEASDSWLATALQTANLSIGRRCAWSSLRLQDLSTCKESLLIVKAVPKADEALDLFTWLRQHSLHVPTFAILPANDRAFVGLAAESVDDFLLWPFHGEELQYRILRLLGPHRTSSMEELQQAFVGQLGLDKIVGTDPAFLQALSRIDQFARSDAAILLTGETGTGKELCARVIHLLSRRRDGPFIPVECGGVPEHLFENEVFGHARGAFTDAHTAQRGLVALAHHGTLFLDEIDSLSLATQGKLLRLLQEQTFRPLGSEMFCRADLHIVAATNRDLSALVREGRFRADLFFRLDVLRVHLPSLRERPRDISTLARYFIAETCAKSGLPRKLLSPASIRKLEAYSWPGNIRELYNTILSAALCSTGTEIVPAAINFRGISAAGDVGEFEPCQEGPATENFRSAKLHAIERFEKEYVRRLLEKHSGNITRAAAQAGKDRRAFGRLVKKYGQAGVRIQAGSQ
jgi:two-component system response regulator GlrR